MTTTTTTTVTTRNQGADTGDYSQELIIAACIVLALIFFLIGLRWLKRRRHAHEHEHLVVDVAEPQTLDDLKR